MPVVELEGPARRIRIHVDHTRHMSCRHSHVVRDLDEGYHLEQVQVQRVVSTMC